MSAGPDDHDDDALLAWELEVARPRWRSLLRAESAFEPRPAPNFRKMAAGAVALEEWAAEVV